MINVPNDPRPYAKVLINGQPVSGLLDSGASISCIGRNAEATLGTLGLKVKRIATQVKTADGASQSIVGYVDVTIDYNSQTKLTRLYIVPSLTQQLYLGIDFWIAFGLFPFPISEVSLTSVDPNGYDSPNFHLLNGEQHLQLEQTKAKFPASTQEGLGKTTVLKHVIETGNATAVKQRHYPVSPAVQKSMYAELDRMIELDVIEVSHSPWNSPVVLVRKSNGKARLCLDSRKLNEATVKDAYPLPLIDGIFSRLNETRFISSIDLKDAFWQIELDESSREKTAFTVPGRPLYQFKRMPFGLCNAPQTLCRLMDLVIPQPLRESVIVYLDDLLIVSENFETHVDLLKQVAGHLRKAKLTINVEKSKFCMKELRYLGYIVGNGCLKADPDKVAAILEFPAPATVRQVRRFLGITGWYRRFIANYADIAAPITDLLSPNGKFMWTESAQEAFDRLKNCLTTAPILTHPNFDQPFIIQCDASSTGVGSVLFQIGKDGLEHPISYMSKKLNAAQRNYSVTELECLSAILSVKKFRGYVEGHPFKIITDHASLKWLMSQKDLAGRLARWSLKLQGFEFSIEHRKGKLNVVPDALSRVYMEEVAAYPCLMVDLDSPHFDAEPYSKMREAVLDDNDRLPDLKVEGKHVFIRTEPRTEGLTVNPIWKLWVPTGLTHEAVKSAHDPPLSSHSGVGKTIARLREQLYWPGMSTLVRTYIGNCSICKETKAPNVVLRPPMGNSFVTNRTWQNLYIDLLGPYPRSKSGNTHLIIVLDSFSKFVLLKPIRKATGALVVQYLELDVFLLFGVPKTIVSDNGVQFLSREFTGLLNKYGVNHITTAIYSPQANAAERVNRSLIASIRAYLDEDQSLWDINIGSICSALRTSKHSATGVTPYYLVFGQHPIQHASNYDLLQKLSRLALTEVEVLPPADFRELIKSTVVDNLEKAHDRNERTYNVRSREVTYQPGQEVFRRSFKQSDFVKGFNSKLAKQWIPARIVRQIGTALYELEDRSGKRLAAKYHAKDLKQ